MGLIRKVLFFVAFLSCVSAAQATDFYVSPSGTSAGNGSLANPWDLQTALNQPSSVKPGDSIWVLAGTYVPPNSNGFVSNLNGTAAAPIIVRNYQGQRATLSGNQDFAVLYAGGSYTWFWGLEITTSCAGRGVAGNITCAVGVGAYGPDLKFINLIVHDTMQGFSAYNSSPDSEYYGNLSYYNGYVGTDRVHGHGMYFQNLTGLKTISENFVGDNADEGIQIYGSGTAALNGFVVSGNTLYNSGSWPAANYQYNVIVAGGLTRQNIRYTNNYSYFPLNAPGGFTQFGQYTDGQDIAIQNNVFVGGGQPTAVADEAGPVSFTGNILYGSPSAGRLLAVALDTGQTFSTYTWDTNTYYDQTAYHFNSPVNGNATNLAFANWQQSTGFEAHSTYVQGAPTGVWVYVQPNKYEAKRANITIYNWDLDAAVPVNLSGLLNPGDQYVIQDAQNFYGPPVASGTYTGSPVSLKMTGLTKAAPVGFPAPAHTAPQLGTFVVLPVAGPSSAPLPPTNLTVVVD
jgi:hypothetical protein